MAFLALTGAVSESIHEVTVWVEGHAARCGRLRGPDRVVVHQVLTQQVVFAHRKEVVRAGAHPQQVGRDVIVLPERHVRNVGAPHIPHMDSVVRNLGYAAKMVWQMKYLWLFIMANILWVKIVQSAILNFSHQCVEF